MFTVISRYHGGAFLAGSADDAARARLQVKPAATRAAVRSDKLGEVAAEFEAVHHVERARQVGSVHSIIAAIDVRPSIISAVERGMARTMEAVGHRPDTGSPSRRFRSPVASLPRLAEYSGTSNTIAFAHQICPGGRIHP